MVTAGDRRTRQERKEHTRAAILDAALALSEHTGLAGLSLRAVAKQAGIVPTAFYRHFASIEDVGLALVDATFASLRQMMREARQTWGDLDEVIETSVATLARHVSERRASFLFMFRERIGGFASVREAIRDELELFERELATDLARLPGPASWPAEDLRVFANLIVGLMVNTAEALLTAPRPEAERTITATAERQLRFLVVGAGRWRGRPDEA